MLKPLLVVSTLAVLMLASTNSSAVADMFGPSQYVLPCQDALHCPDLTIDRSRLSSYSVYTRTFTESSCSVQEGTATPGTHKLISPNLGMPNVGSMDLIIGTPSQNPGLFEWGACHRHWHFIAYASIRLWKVDDYQKWLELRSSESREKSSNQILAEHPELQPIVGDKIGYCVINVAGGYQSRMPLFYKSSGHRPNCSDMGVTVGRADVYGAGTEGQWVIVDNVPPGTYMLEGEVNADRMIQEFDYKENAAAVQVTL